MTPTRKIDALWYFLTTLTASSRLRTGSLFTETRISPFLKPSSRATSYCSMLSVVIPCTLPSGPLTTFTSSDDATRAYSSSTRLVMPARSSVMRLGRLTATADWTGRDVATERPEFVNFQSICSSSRRFSRRFSRITDAG